MKAFDHCLITITGRDILAVFGAVPGHGIKMSGMLLWIMVVCVFSFLDVNLVLAALEPS